MSKQKGFSTADILAQAVGITEMLRRDGFKACGPVVINMGAGDETAEVIVPVVLSQFPKYIEMKVTA